MTRPEIPGDWRAATLVGLATLVLPFAIVACLWRIYGVPPEVNPLVPTRADIQLRALPAFILLAAMNAGFVYAPRTRLQKWAHILGATFGMVAAFSVAECYAFASTFDEADPPRYAIYLFHAATAAGVAGLAFALTLCAGAASALEYLRARFAKK